MYVLGILLNAGALVYAVMDDSPLFAVTFGVIMLYLGLRYRMVSSS